MGLLDIFKSKKQKHIEYIKTIISVYSAIKGFIDRRIKLIEIGVLIDLDFDSNMKEQLLINQFNKNGVFKIIDDDARKLLLKIFNDQELIKDDIFEINNYLIGVINESQDKIIKLNQS